MKRVVLTFLLTSLFWWMVFTYWAYTRNEQASVEEIELVEEQPALEGVEQQSNNAVVKKVNKATPTTSTKSAPAKEQASPAKQEPVAKGVTLEELPQTQVVQHQSDQQEIVGKWKPIEGAKNTLEITKYGAIIQTVYDDINMRYDYQIIGDRMKIGYDDATFKVINEGNTTYLEIYNSEDFSGKYRRISQPSKINASVIDKSEYPTYIIGKWIPITGQEYPIEFTKFNTVIQMVYDTIDMRYEYSLKGDRLSIRYDNNARVVISEDANNYYLEIFNTTDFSGRYRKSK